MLRKSNVRLETRLGALASTTMVLAIIAICSPNDWLRSNLWVLYTIQYGFILHLISVQKDRWLFILSPSFVTASYIAINNCLGAYFFNAKMVLSVENYFSYLTWRNLGWIAAFIISANFIIVFAHFCIGKSRIRKSRKLELNDPLSDFFVIVFCLIIILSFTKWEFLFPFFGYGGNLSEVPQTLAGILIVIALRNQKISVRCVAYLLLLLLFASFSSQDKRIAIYLLAPMMLIECLKMGQLRLNIKLLAATLMLVGLILTLVIMMSIYRGYGSYHPEGFFDTSNYILSYIRKSEFYSFIGNNLEFNYIFYHLHQAIEYVFNSPDLLLYGSTFVKVLFVFFPRSFVSFKPDSIITHYTQYHDWDLRAAGGSWVSTIYADFFWNFHIFGLFGLFLLYYLATQCYFVLAYRLRQGVHYQYLIALFAYQHILTLIRGSGFDLYFVLLLVGAILYLIVFIPVVTISKYLSQILKHGTGGRTRRSEIR